jgi:hypothetical protein
MEWLDNPLFAKTVIEMPLKTWTRELGEAAAVDLLIQRNATVKLRPEVKSPAQVPSPATVTLPSPVIPTSLDPFTPAVTPVLTAGTCLECGDQGHYAAICPRAETPVAETPVAETPVAETPVAETPVAETPVAETPDRCENITHQSEATPTTRGATATNSTAAAGSTSSGERGDSGGQPSTPKEKCATTSPVATTSLASTAIATATTIAASTAAINAAAAGALDEERRNKESQPSSSNKQATIEISEDSKTYSGASQENVTTVLPDMASGGDLGLKLAETARRPRAEQ